MRKKLVSKIIQTCIFQYVKLLIITGDKNLSHFTILLEKIRKDKEIFENLFENTLDKEILDEKLHILDEFLNFMSSPIDNIRNSCEALRKYAGETFSISIAYALLKLRIDLHQGYKEKAMEICREVFDQVYINPDPNINQSKTTTDAEKRRTFYGLLDSELNATNQVMANNSVVEYIKKRSVKLDVFLNLSKELRSTWAERATTEKFVENYMDEETIYSGNLKKKDLLAG